MVGAGLVGLATARALLAADPPIARSLFLFEKEPEPSRHQSGRNSGVLHAGLAYKPGSRKARLATEGARALEAYCAERGVALRRTGMIVAALAPEDVPRLHELARRGRANGLAGLRMMSPAEVREREPAAADFPAALLVPEEGVVDFPGVARALASDIERMGGALRLGDGVRALRRRNEGGWIVETASGGAVEVDWLVNCAGLHSDRVARMAGETDLPARIVPFRGEYFRLTVEAAGRLVRQSIYPAPDPRFPFLGVHLTRRIDGVVVAGPNAVLSLHREGYGRFPFSLRDAADAISYAGFWRLALRHLRVGALETFRSMSRARFLREARRLVPALEASDLEPFRPGVRAQAVLPDGTLCDDFLWIDARDALHVLNAPSPAATACLAIGEEIARRVAERWAGERG